VALARALRDREGIGALFAVNGSEDALEPIRRAGFEAVLIDGADDVNALGALIDERTPEMLVCDQREGLDRAALASLGSRVVLTAVIDDASSRRLAADFAYYPPVPQAEALDWQGSHCECRLGWQWAILGLGKPSASWNNPSSRSTLLVTMGGSDPHELTLKCAHALAKLDPVFRARFVIGPGVANPAQRARAIVALAPNFETLEGADGLATEFASCDAALASFGVTAYELAAYGVPALYLCLTEDHAHSASAFEAAGIGQSLGLAESVRGEDIASASLALLNDPARRREMRAAGLATIDGEGAARVAADLAKHLVERRSATPALSAG
jgi:spore coat polysaccharide biosynthesis protein SpsF